MQSRNRTGSMSSVTMSAMTLVVLAIVGCALDDGNPLAPTGNVLDPGSEIAPDPVPRTPARKPETITVITATEDIFSAVLVTAKAGGVVTAGRHRLRIPPGALKSDTIIQLKDVTGTAGFVSCEAYPEGLEFLKPALLESSFRDLKSPLGFTIYWIANPGKSDEEWVDMRAGLSTDGQGLGVSLHHFSTYAPGKAGWSPRRGGSGHFRPIN